MIERWARHIARWIIRYNTGKPVSEGELVFFIMGIVSNFSVITASLVMGLILHSFVEACYATFSFATLRFFSGGRHMISLWSCLVVSVVLILTAVSVPLSFTMQIVLLLTTGILLMIYAPAKGYEENFISGSRLRVYKVASLLLLTIAALISYNPITIAFFLQSLTLIRPITWKGGVDR